MTSKNLVHAALFLAVTLAGIGGVFFVLAADFVALVQLVVYVGAIAVLFLFGLMLTRAPIGREALDSQNRGMGMAIAGVLFAVLVTLIVQSSGDFAAEAGSAVGGAIDRGHRAVDLLGLGVPLRGRLDAAARGPGRRDPDVAARVGRVRRGDGHHARSTSATPASPTSPS